MKHLILLFLMLFSIENYVLYSAESGDIVKEPPPPAPVDLWSIQIKNFNVEISEKGKEDFPCAKEPNALLEHEHVKFLLEFEGRGRFAYNIQVMHSGFKRRLREKEYLIKDFDELKGEVRLGLPHEYRTWKNHKTHKIEKVKWKIRSLEDTVNHSTLTAILRVYPIHHVNDKRFLQMAKVQIPVYRYNRLERYLDPKMSCVQVFPPELDSGWIYNQNDRDLEISIAHGSNRMETEKQARSANCAFSPIVIIYGIGVGFGNISESYMREVTSEKGFQYSLTTNHFIDPGDKAIIYKQRTRRVDGYQVKSMDYCGNEETIGDALFVEKETYVHNIYKERMGRMGEPVYSSCQEIDKALNNFQSRMTLQ